MARFSGTSGNDSLQGTSASDQIYGFGGNDTLAGLEGNDQLFGGAGDDILSGRAGRDRLEGSGGADYLDGGVGRDTLLGGDGDDRLLDGGGDDVVSGGEGNDTFVSGSSGNDVTSGGAGNDVIYYLGTASYGSDRIDGGSGIDTLNYFSAYKGVMVDLAAGTVRGGDVSGTGSATVVSIENVTGSEEGADRIAGNSAANWISGAGGDDDLRGGLGNDTVRGNADNDDIMGGSGNDYLDGGFGSDTVNGGSGNDYLVGGYEQPEALVGASDTLIGGDGNDTLDGWSTNATWSDAYADYLNGGLGDDYYRVDRFDDVLSDAGGTDSVAATISWKLGPGFEKLFLTQAGLLGIGNGLDNVMSGPSDTRIEGQGGNDYLIVYSSSQAYGGAGNDTIEGDGSWLSGQDGNDRLIAFPWSGSDMVGGRGRDTLIGSVGMDRFFFGETPGTVNADVVCGFVPSEDQLLFDNEMFTALGSAGSWSVGDGRFYAAANATSGHDSNDRLIYNTASGKLYYDADGSGGGAALIAATLEAAPTLSAADITVI